LKALELGVDEEKFLKQLEEKKEEEQLTSFFTLQGIFSGSIEAIQGLIEKLPTDEIQVHVARTGIGAISESDIKIASTSINSLDVGTGNSL